MKELSVTEISEVSGGFPLLNLGAVMVALMVGAMAGPTGLGMVLSGLVATYGINELEAMGNSQFGNSSNR